MTMVSLVQMINIFNGFNDFHSTLTFLTKQNSVDAGNTQQVWRFLEIKLS